MTTPIPDPPYPQDGHSRQGWPPLLDAVPQGVILVGPSGRFLEVNPAAEQILGRDRETLLSCSLPGPWSNVTEADGSALAPDDFPGRAALTAGSPAARKTIGWNREDGSTLWLEMSANRLQGGGALISFGDVTEHRVQSRKLDRLTQLYAALSHLNQAIVWSPTKEALLDKVCEVMVEFGKFKLAWIGWDDPETHEVRIICQCGDTHGYLHGLRVRSDDTPLGRGGTGTAIREGRVVVKNDLLGVLEMSPWQEAAIHSGFVASASIPIRCGGKVGGALMVYASEKHFFGAQELELLEGVAEDVSFALAHLDLETQRKRAEEALLEREERYRTFFDHGPDGIVVLDPATARPVEFNDQVCRQLGYTREEFQTLTLADIEANETPDETARTIKGVLETGIADFETRQRTRQGEVRDVHVTAQRIQVGGVNAYHCVWRDITRRKAAEVEILQANEDLERRVKERTAQLESANSELEAFSYSVSHDLRAPLRSIDGFSQILLEDYQDRLDADGIRCLTRIRSGTQRMDGLINNLLQLSKTGRSELEVTECDLSGLCSRVAGDQAELHPERRVDVAIQPGMLVQADHHLMGVVLENLLGNAWKFTSKCQDPKIEMGETVSPGGERTFFMRDNGAGFDMARAGKLFTAFQRFHAEADYDGTGIGLAIVQRIIHRHGGRIWADAGPGKGATFFFTLPLSGKG